MKGFTEQPHVCLAGFANHLIDLFGAKPRSESLLNVIEWNHFSLSNLMSLKCRHTES